MEIPNGVYQVTVGVGDATHASHNTINVEGINFCQGLDLDKGTTEFTKPVEVKDGRLTVDCGDEGSRKTKITFVAIAGPPSN